MEYRTASTKLPSTELSLFRAHCDKKGVTPANLIRTLILAEMKITVPNFMAGKNKIKYNKAADTYVWSILLDTEKEIPILEHVSPWFLSNLNQTIQRCLEERDTFIQKTKDGSVPIPSEFFRRFENE